MKGQLAAHRLETRSPQAFPDETLEAILAIDFDRLPFEAIYGRIVGELMRSHVITGHKLSLVGPQGSRELAAAVGPASRGAPLQKWDLHPRGPRFGESLRFEVRQGSRWVLAGERLMPTVLRLLSLSWTRDESSDGAIQRASGLDSLALLGLYELIKTFDPALPTEELANRILRQLHAYVPFDLAGLAFTDTRKTRAFAVSQKLTAFDEALSFLSSLQDILVKQGVMGPFAPKLLSPLEEVFVRDATAATERFEMTLTARGGRVLGVLVLARRDGVAFQESERRSLTVLQGHLATLLENRDLLLELERQAKTDAMTDLFNYRTFRSLLSQEISRSRRYRKPMSLIILDVDFFKQINDTYGHPKGDEALRALARLLMSQKRKEDLVARYGGEEFVLILPETSPEGALRLAQRIRESVEKTTLIAEKAITVSVGVATLDPDSALREDQLIFQADNALGEAKKRGRNQVVVG